MPNYIDTDNQDHEEKERTQENNHIDLFKQKETRLKETSSTDSSNV